MNVSCLKAKTLSWVSLLTLAIFLGACSTAQEKSARPDVLNLILPSKAPISYARLGATDPVPLARTRVRPTTNLPKPLLAKIVVPKSPLQCVPYARKLSNIQIRGDAWTWWGQAEGRYPRGSQPAAGAVMVLKKKNANSLGHVAHVDEVIDNRTLVVSHANWLNKGRIHNHMPVIDVSEANDWSAVRFWNADGGHFGGSIYRPYGFIHQNQMVASR